MQDCLWEEIHGFSNLNEFKRFLDWLNAQEREGIIEKLPEEPIDPMRGIPVWKICYFRCLVTGEVWQLTFPDPPYSGSWYPRKRQ